MGLVNIWENHLYFLWNITQKSISLHKRLLPYKKCFAHSDWTGKKNLFFLFVFGGLFNYFLEGGGGFFPMPLWNCSLAVKCETRSERKYVFLMPIHDGLLSAEGNPYFSIIFLFYSSVLFVLLWPEYFLYLLPFQHDIELRKFYVTVYIKIEQCLVFVFFHIHLSNSLCLFMNTSHFFFFFFFYIISYRKLILFTITVIVNFCF